MDIVSVVDFCPLFCTISSEFSMYRRNMSGQVCKNLESSSIAQFHVVCHMILSREVTHVSICFIVFIFSFFILILLV